ncbi:putative srpk [Xylariales sp. AK1849]|nr:putative srpk [Xylariales sp. AK1849]
MSTRGPLYEHVDDVERLDYYRPGGYHPIRIGDIFQKRYQIVHKLGYGSYSTIWLARDDQMAKYVAIKVGTADHGPKELQLLSQISASTAYNGGFGSNLIFPVLDHFDVEGPNGTHSCLVTTPARCSLADAAEAADYSPFNLCVARSISAQLAMAVAHIHELGYVHGARFEPTESLSYPSDIWSLGYMIWAILGVRPFLDSWLFGPDDATMDQVDAQGPMPDEWWETWEKGSKCFVGNDAIQAPRRRMGTEVIDEEERDALFKMIRGMLVFRPGDRLSASRVLRTEWMRKWAVPEAENTWGLGVAM